ncbi:putative signal peptide protein [Halorubrum sp. AJ67]|nr:putative signal peptide protein [Halorubrum sp. AJ67]
MRLVRCRCCRSHRYSIGVCRFRISPPQSGHEPGLSSARMMFPHSKHSYGDSSSGA